jgi:hypothetical protein
VLRADGNPIPIEEFIADGQRHWAALRAGDERLSVQAQRTAQAGTRSGERGPSAPPR